MVSISVGGLHGGLQHFLTLMIFMVSLYSIVIQASDTWQRLPSLETFSSYEDMQRYFDQRKLRSMRHIDNPTDDTYLNAFNQYNEQHINENHSRPKREERKLPTAPRMLRFELSDAVEPSAEVKQMIRIHHERALKNNATPQPTTVKPLIVNTTQATKSGRMRKPRRSRRSTNNGSLRQPANFKVQMIPFEATDAREPDAITAQLIKQARALDLSKSPPSQTAPVEVDIKKPRKSGVQVRIRKTKRSKRSTPPQMFKFELADAKDGLHMPQQERKGKELPTLLTMETQMRGNQTQMATTPAPRLDDNVIHTGESSSAESKRIYVYKEVPTKTKKSITALPHEVQKVISHLMLKDGGHGGGKAYIKYLPAQKNDYEHFKKSIPSYSLKPTTYVKYLPVKSSVEPAHQVQVHIQPVPVVEQLRYVYKPNYAKIYAAPTPTIAQPIVVSEAAPAPTTITEEVHHTYTADLTAPAPPPLPPPSDIITPQFRPSKPDPLQNDQYGLPVASPLIKIEYHAPADSLNEHYKQLPEFQQLSSLIGKSPDDQIHGLTYLLAKEMQTKLQRQGKQLLVDRPQDSTAPILFHPSQVAAPAPTPPVVHGSLGVQPGRLIGMAKTKQYVPIIEPGNNDVKELPAIAAKQLPTPSSFIDFIPGHGLSHGYEGVKNEDEVQPLTTKVEHVVVHHHHLAPEPHEQLATALPAHLGESEKNALHYVSTSHEDKSLQQYASKYAFGYRIRDFHTGNDFGHKQNRDLHGVTRGQYHILLPDGRIQNVIYHADDTGFHADVSFENGKH
ncbi:uncharacterized protein Dwil_GK17854 [Drosophila willistoni]|uniref:Uncharacterized protein n=1 Tax=Drosophila willistoni TaxID=7260 RepID=B4N5V2_DROWI|nr:uncharacterized protein LOC6646111 [Drosophila willistoni]EDW79741.2 uncharacterized protein Dwil_GK17854 [Drosophila willistoni]